MWDRLSFDYMNMRLKRKWALQNFLNWRGEKH